MFSQAMMYKESRHLFYHSMFENKGFVRVILLTSLPKGSADKFIEGISMSVECCML